MKTKTFNENYTIDRKSKGVKALPINAPVEPVEIKTADGAAYDASETYYFFEEQSAEVMQSAGLRRDSEHLCTFGLKVAAISKLRSSQDDALADGQVFFKLEIEGLQTRIQKFELEKTVDAPNLKLFSTAKV